ncbi:histidine phosphatase family protein [Zobellia amurskyensis]|uniref:Histidine phosphatase family protein n=1 Tax=Zobellia amurskyensis TaxID=248905 RepID=A0A7X2ZRZ5_9FLAO|nr:phosphoglycerate mutase family protein [Zobellia amurskyensis]MUH35282.1 histidine phosphatase family protein [Zobellia amurskyensis]
MQRIKSFYIILFISLIFASCKEDQKVTQETDTKGVVSTFYFIRHAEKDRSDPENTDPELNQRGLGRAMHWAEILKDIELDVIYTTDYERTSMTAAPTAVKKELDVKYYEPQNVNLEQFKADNLGKKVLVVGHSNTTPDFVNQMIGEDLYYEMDDSDNGSLFIVQLIDNHSTSQRIHINCNCPKER